MVTAGGEDLYALVATGAASECWAISEDGGRRWEGSEPPSTGSSPTTTGDVYDDPGPTGQQEACAPDATCWRLRDRRSIDRVAPDGTAVEEFRLTEREFSDISTGCAGGSIGFLAGPDTDGARMISRVAVPGMILTTVAAIVVARRPARTRPLSSYPSPTPPAAFPPPPPPPPASPAAGDDG